MDFVRLSSDKQDLEEADEIASRGSMKLHQADILLERARLHRDKGETQQAREFLKMAKALIDECGYHRRDAEVQALERELGEV